MTFTSLTTSSYRTEHRPTVIATDGFVESGIGPAGGQREKERLIVIKMHVVPAPHMHRYCDELELPLRDWNGWDE